MARNYVLKTKGGDLSVKEGGSLTGGYWKMEEGQPVNFTVTGVFRKGSIIATSGITTAPDVLDVVDLQDGLPKKVLASKVLVSTLSEQFPNDTYVGKSFRVTVGPKPAGKRYKSMDIRQLELEPASEETPEVTPAPTPEPTPDPASGKKRK